ncbi:hypothetical protein KUTeg_006900 [Tegillarca granosa]|uniref:RING-type domain-containing protein n=1 Tax=Tegillarca granosa TaxID=220873 RepID=A0ABQ9FBN9_TEGGR|nr:hypothetical protein KUTeg_006900 [Tegillarca granosa]
MLHLSLYKMSGSNLSGLVAAASFSVSANKKKTGIAEDPGLLKYERNRLETFKNWPVSSPIPPKDLAQSGFYYTGNEDRVQCAFCRGILKGWDPGDDPQKEHEKRFEKCGFILGLNVGNVPLLTKKTVPILSPDFSNSAENLGVSSERAKHENFAVESTRLMTFSRLGWDTRMYQTPEMLAAAGFFYTGTCDNVKCFFCDGGIRNWQPGDDPWTEHARYFPNCYYVKLVKGQDFIKKIHEKYNNEKSIGVYQSAKVYGRRSRENHFQVDENAVGAQLDLPWVRIVLDTGVSREIVAQVIQDRLRSHGDNFPNTEELMEAVLTMQEAQAAVLSSTGQNQDNEPNMSGTEVASCNLEKENKMLRDQKTCKVCLDKEVGIVFLPCGHLCCCVSCAPAVRKCPICRGDIKGTVRTYIP